MTTKLKPWHELVTLKDELRTGELTLAEFAADLHEVTLSAGKRPVYEDPEKFFALTYPTHALRELVKDVALRLSGQSDKAVRQLELTYGGGKTHTLITLYHLFGNLGALPDVSAVREFSEHVGADIPRAFVAALCFDKIDVERGIEGVRGPDGEAHPRLQHPWSVLAYQLAGADGLRAIHAEGRAEERETPPAEPLLVKLIEMPGKRDMATLILVDEVLMYAREKAGLDSVWRERIVDFFQYLTQAVIKVDRAAIVASLLATDPAKQQGELSGRLMNELFAVFRRQREEGIQPVQKQDVAEVLRRRFFEREELRNLDTFRSHVIGIVRGLSKLDETTAKERRKAEDRFLGSFPFHPDLADVLYSRWTQLDSFQRTRGILRTLAFALREAEKWDVSPLVGPAALLAGPEQYGASSAMTELASVAGSSNVEGGNVAWGPLLEAEWERARKIQDEIPSLQHGREAEQAVAAVFLYSQPVGRKVATPELLRISGSCGPDAIELRKGLTRWREISWFLDDEDSVIRDDGQELPKSWRLGNRPNLRQMHDEACQDRITDDDVEARLLEAIRKARSSLDGGASATGASMHLLPAAPRDVSDDGSFRYVVLGPAAASESGKPSKLARKYIDETTGPNRPRVHRNALILAVPSRDGLEAARATIRSLLGWEEVQRQLSNQRVDPIQTERLRRLISEARERSPGAIRQAYCIVVAASQDNEIHAFKLTARAGPLFPEIKNDERSRVKETPVDAEALLPDGPYDLWREDEDARLVKDIAGAFARDPRLPKMLNSRILLDTILQGVERGLFVARLKRPDGSFRTWWRMPVDAESVADPLLEVVLPQKAQLTGLDQSLLGPEVLPELWRDERLTLEDIKSYFSGNHVVTMAREGYEDRQVIPACGEDLLRDSIENAIKEGTVWLISGPASFWKEDIPFGAIDKNAALRPRPDLIPVQELMDDVLPAAWKNGGTNGAALMQALSQARGEAIPWGLVRDSISAALQNRWLEAAETPVWDEISFHTAGQWKLRRAERAPSKPDPSPGHAGLATLDGAQVQDLAEQVPQLLEASAGWDLRFNVGISLDSDAPPEIRAQIEKLLAPVSDALKVPSGD